MLDISNDFNTAYVRLIFCNCLAECYNLLPLYAQVAGENKAFGRTE